MIYKPLQSKEIRNRIGKIPPKVPPSRIHWGFIAAAARRTPPTRSKTRSNTSRSHSVPVWGSRLGSKRGEFVLSISARCRCSNVLRSLIPVEIGQGRPDKRSRFPLVPSPDRLEIAKSGTEAGHRRMCGTGRRLRAGNLLFSASLTVAIYCSFSAGCDDSLLLMNGLDYPQLPIFLKQSTCKNPHSPFC